jgi:hypothetical protein
MHDAVNVGLSIATRPQHAGQLLQSGNRFQILRHLLGPETAIEIGPQSHIPRITGKLTVMINVIHEHAEPQAR